MGGIEIGGQPLGAGKPEGMPDKCVRHLEMRQQPIRPGQTSFGLAQMRHSSNALAPQVGGQKVGPSRRYEADTETRRPQGPGNARRSFPLRQRLTHRRPGQVGPDCHDHGPPHQADEGQGRCSDPCPHAPQSTRRAAGDSPAQGQLVNMHEAGMHVVSQDKGTHDNRAPIPSMVFLWYFWYLTAASDVRTGGDADQPSALTGRRHMQPHTAPTSSGPFIQPDRPSRAFARRHVSRAIMLGFLAVAGQAAHAAVLDFDDLALNQSGVINVPTPYHGILWGTLGDTGSVCVGRHQLLGGQQLRKQLQLALRRKRRLQLRRSVYASLSGGGVLTSTAPILVHHPIRRPPVRLGWLLS